MSRKYLVPGQLETERLWLVRVREQSGLTQEEFAHAIGVTVATVNRWENGRTGISRLAKNAIENFERKSNEGAT